MSTKAPTHAAAIRPDLATFYLAKERLAPLNQALARLMQREDLSGKFARKVALQRRGIREASESLDEERLELIKRHAERFPKFLEDGVTPHPKAGEFKPVYQMQQNPTTGEQTPVYKKDAAGNDTDERVIIPDQYDLVDPVAFTKDWKDALKEIIAVTLPAMKLAELEAFKNIRGDVMDALLDIEEGAPTTVKPTDFKTLELVPDKKEEEPPTSEKPPAEGESRTAP